MPDRKVRGGVNVVANELTGQKSRGYCRVGKAAPVEGGGSCRSEEMPTG